MVQRQDRAQGGPGTSILGRCSAPLHGAWLDAELGLAWIRGRTRALQTLLPDPKFLGYHDASVPLFQHRFLEGHQQVIAGGPRGIWSPNRTGAGLP